MSGGARGKDWEKGTTKQTHRARAAAAPARKTSAPVSSNASQTTYINDYLKITDKMSSSTEKPRLSAEQKKANHIESERKRREAIRNGFENLSNIVPESQGQARSEGIVLANTVKHIHDLQAKKEELRKESQKKGVSDLEFEQHYRDAAKKKRDERDGKETSTPASRPSSSRDAKS